MPAFILPPLVKWTLVAVGGAAMVHWVVKEVRRVNEEIERARRPVPISERERLQTLRRDPRTGEYRPSA